MPKTYYDSELTGAQIEDALEAIHGVVTPSNNGKVLCIVNGAISAKSASEWGHGAVLEPLNVSANGDYTPPTGTDGFDSVHVAVPGATLTTKSITQNGTYNASSDNADGYSSVTVNVSGGGSAVVQPLSVTQNGTYNPPSGVDGYAPVTVNVSGGGGTLPIDATYLPNSDSSKILTSSFIPESLVERTSVAGLIKSPADTDIANSPYGECFYTELGTTNTDVTCYCVAKRVGTQSGEILVLGVPYAMSNGNDPCFDFQNNAGRVDFATWSSNTTWTGLDSRNYVCLAIAVNGTTKKARFFANGIIHPTVPEKSFNNSGSYVCFGAGNKDTPTTYGGDVQFAYCGVVKEFESDATVIANMQTIMQKLGLE